jgi:hypothetical protein
LGLSPIGDVSEDEVGQLHYQPAKPGVLFQERYDVVRTFVVRIIFIAKRSFLQASLFIEKFSFAIRRICGSHDESPIQAAERTPSFPA